MKDESTTRSALVRKYRAEQHENIAHIELSVNALAGSYLYHYSGDPIGGLNLDINKGSIPTVKGLIARELINAALKQEASS